MKTSNISTWSRIMILVSGILLVISIFIPIWRIELDAPQYPEGLKLLIYSNALGGDVEIINGLNHYIGMETLHKNNFIEFTILPYCIGFFAIFAFLVAFTSKRSLLFALLFSFIAFGIIAMADFWRWEYNYGHHLNPNAAIIVPGMAYQPPLIGFKQLLNFGAYSIPDIGGWLFIVSGILMLVTVLFEKNIFKRKQNNVSMFLVLISLGLLSSCVNSRPEPIQLNKDNCAYCKMTIVNGQMAAEFKTNKGRAYKFDDIGCMINYVKENSALQDCKFYVSDFLAINNLIDIEHSFLIHGEAIESPMGGNVAAFKTEAASLPYQQKFTATKISWKELLQ